MATWDEHEVEDLTFEDLGAMLSAGEALDNEDRPSGVTVNGPLWTVVRQSSHNRAATPPGLGSVLDADEILHRDEHPAHV